MTASARKSKQQSTDIYVIGTGIKGVQHLTLEAIQAMEFCTTVFTVDHGFGVLPYIRKLGPKVVDLISEYHEGKHRLETYQHMAAKVIEAALQRPPVAFATYGHPQWLVFPTELISEAARHLKLKVTPIAGISCIDTLVLELGIDPAARGLQIHEATGLVLKQIPLVPSIPVILLQVDAFQNEVFSAKRTSRERHEVLVSYLEKYYPLTHPVLSVYSSTHPLMKPITTTFKLSELPDVFASGTVSGTLYIPPNS